MKYILKDENKKKCIRMSITVLKIVILEVNCQFNPTALRKAKIIYNFGFSECNRVNGRKLFFTARLFCGCETKFATIKLAIYLLKSQV